VGWPEDRNTVHWLENKGTVPAVEISVDVVEQDHSFPGCSQASASQRDEVGVD
jgi:hypothetical protein